MSHGNRQWFLYSAHRSLGYDFTVTQSTEHREGGWSSSSSYVRSRSLIFWPQQIGHAHRQWSVINHPILIEPMNEAIILCLMRPSLKSWIFFAAVFKIFMSILDKALYSTPLPCPKQFELVIHRCLICLGGKRQFLRLKGKTLEH